MNSRRLFLIALVHFLLLPACFAQAKDDPCQAQYARPDCHRAVAFFLKLQEAFRHDDRKAVAAMVAYPLRVQLNGKPAFMRSRQQLLANYDKVFDPVIRCEVLAAKKEDVWGNWQGFTIRGGELWWEASGMADNAPFRVITVNNGSFYKGCSVEKKTAAEAVSPRWGSVVFGSLPSASALGYHCPAPAALGRSFCWWFAPSSDSLERRNSQAFSKRTP
jgi:hypothetical protein